MDKVLLTKLVEEWKKLAKSGEKEKAVDFSLNYIIPEKTKELTKSAKKLGIYEYYDLLVIPAGLVADLYVLLINSLKPKKVFFVSSEEFINGGYLQTIQKHTYLNSKNTLVKTINYNDLSMVTAYRELNDVLKYVSSLKIAVDMTWGKATLLAGAGIYACLKSYDTVYINSEGWLKNKNLSVRGSEKLVKIRNPLHVFGDLGNHYSAMLLKNGMFKSSSEVYKTLTTQVEDPREYEIKHLISYAYENWGNFQYASAEKLLHKAIVKIDQFGILKNYRSQLLKNIEITSTLKIFENTNISNHKIMSNNKLMLYLLVDLLHNAKRKIDTEENAEAYQVLYRIVELISQHRLAKYKISTINQPEHEKLREIRKNYIKASKDIFGIKEDIPKFIGTKSGHLILFLLKDDLYKHEQITQLTSLFDLLKARDHSFLSHGFGIITNKASTKFYAVIIKLVNNLAKEYGIGMEDISLKIASVDME